jgi:ketosteroid isomerase-like protein
MKSAKVLSASSPVWSIAKHGLRQIRHQSSTARNDLEKTTLSFLKALETRADIKPFYHPDIVQTEFPNGIVKSTVNRNLTDISDSFAKGQKVLQKESYEVKQIHSFNNTVVLEAIWRGTLAIPLGKIPVGGVMTAYFCQVYEFKDGKIYRQRNYDCFEPFQ